MQQCWKKVFIIAIYGVVCHGVAFSQPKNYRLLRPPQSSRPMFTISLGVTTPQGRDGLREFWLSGFGGSAEFLLQRNSMVALGIGADLSWLYFDVAAFAQRWPGVPLDNKQNLFVGNVYLDATYSFLPGRQTRPFLSTQLGAEFIS